MDAPPPPPPLNGPSGAAPPGTADFVDAPAAAVNGWAHHQAFVKPDPQQDPEQDQQQQQQQQQQLAAYDGGGYVPVAPPGPAATDSDVKPASLLCPPASAPPAAGADDVGVDVNNHADFTEMQRLSEEYTPDVHGPLVGQLKSSKAIAIEYANADPTFVRKTSNLMHKYSSYRTIRGDGNCGWRAVAFGFFELLLKSGDQNRIGMEHARIKSLCGLMDSVGFPAYVYEDFAEETFSVLRALGSALGAPSDDAAALVGSFNSQDVSDSIVTHFKFLTSAWIKSNPDLYQPFLDTPVVDYCGSAIEPYGIEIDHVGLMALAHCLVLPAGMAVEIIYLDRSDVDEVNVHRFDKLEGDGLLAPPDAPTLRLLYRPGHYDILYKMEDLPVAVPPAFAPLSPVQQQPVQVSFISVDPEQSFLSTPIDAYQDLFTPYDPTPGAAAAAAAAGVVTGFDLQPPPSSGLGNFRQSMLSIPEFQPSPFQPLPFQTTTFRNSPFNPSHFQSENFQPEIYQPPTSPTSSTTPTTAKKADRYSHF